MALNEKHSFQDYTHKSFLGSVFVDGRVFMSDLVGVTIEDVKIGEVP
jgi:hypothetical protein